MKKKLPILQNKVIRFIKAYTPRTSISFQDYVDLNMLNVNNRVKQLRLGHIHRVYYNKCPSYLKNNFERREDRMQYNTRSSSFNFNVPNFNNVSKLTFYYHGIVDWNALPEEIKAVKNAHKYKLMVKKYLINKQVTDNTQDFVYY